MSAKKRIERKRVKGRKRASRLARTTGCASELHAALKPMAEGCMASAIAIHTLGMKLLNTTGYSKNAALAGNLAADTLKQINALIGDERHNASRQGRREETV